MKILQLITGIGGVALVALGGAMALTNPPKNAYEEYAVQKLSTYLKDEVCIKAPNKLDFLPQNSEFLQNQCKSLVDTTRPQIQQIISQKTERQNFVIFSIYRSDLNVKPILPNYHFETVGIFQNFYTYQADKQ
ncbi:DUF4359 domain-containing protein [Limnofasciculus baicalensis]|uniref:DUF4359 domain-containing protein n=1 Tax=Limnofasciculus baicalensis BBK-W-15 TaxID=2699891 RepID=A0AAE3GV62_9CYAN|nr:DUF4359 domain-containing protein [Limnofasciculus baicalensis]MCP2730662.1 DUF4359 domain-containing protein [Limnofasciculus baicalensis BBK-W-15]